MDVSEEIKRLEEHARGYRRLGCVETARWIERDIAFLKRKAGVRG